MTIIIGGSLVILLAGMLIGATGFGFALVSAPILIIFLSPKIVVPLVVMYTAFSGMITLFQARKWVALKDIWLLIIGGIIGLPAGTYLLFIVDADVLKVVIGCLVIPFAIAYFWGFKKQIKNEKLASLCLGFSSGLLATSTSLAGPPIILFYVNQKIAKQTFRANLAAYFTALYSVSAFTLALGGAITADVIRYAIWFLPPAIFGAIIGIKLSHKVPERVFPRVALIVMSIASLLAITSGLGVW